ncbi:MAG: TRL domain-containing protein [Elusimicrobiota bacterium]|jgi:hypothetical protein
MQTACSLLSPRLAWAKSPGQIGRYAAVAALTAALSGCGLLYTNIHMARTWRAATPADVKSAPSDKTVTGQACARSVLFLFAWGDAGYAAASRDALKGEPANALLYDVKVDRTGQAYVLGLYAKTCVQLTGRVALQ